MPAPTHRLVRRPPLAVRAPLLDPEQQRVVEHPGGPLLVLAGPGTGKTTAIVESVVHRVRARGAAPESVLVLTFSRKAAGELRSRIAIRLGRTTREPLALTFHSYAYGLLRREALRAGEPVPRLLTGPEQDLEIRRLLRGEVEDGGHDWPERLRPALLTRGFAAELRDLLLRVQERGLGAAGLAELASAAGRDDWRAAAGFLQRYTERFAVDAAGPVLDYAELVRRAGDLLGDTEVAAAEQAARRHLYVDEYQDTDPAQERLLRALAGGGRDLVAVGDPDQSIYAFRGADVGGIRQFPGRFPAANGTPAPVIALRTCRRSGAALLAASRRIAARLPATAGTRQHRDLHPTDAAPGGVEVRLTGSAASEAAMVADVLRRAHLLDRVPWSRMAVLVRSAHRSIPVLRRALAAADVPTVVAGDEAPLVGDPAVRPLLLLMQCALRPESLTETAAVELLGGPLGRADAIALRRLRRGLAQLRAQSGEGEVGMLLADALRDPRDLVAIRPDVRRPAERIARLLRAAVDSGADGSAEDVLWAIWSGSGLAARWETASAAGGPAGDAADRGLDAVLALFDAAARFVDRLPGAGPTLFLDDVLHREIPGDTLAEQAPSGDAVRLLTAHRAKGLEWDVVVVAGVQEGSWPDLRLRSSLLGSDELVDVVAGRAAGGGTAAGLLAEERRLFYVAVTRARHRLVVTAVGGSEEDTEERPSRFLGELLPSYDAVPAEAPRPLSLRSLVAELRSVVTDGDAAAGLRQAAACELATLGAAGVPGADPGEWYALTAISTAEPVSYPGEQVSVSPSQVEGVVRCPLRWLLERAVGASGAPGPAQAVGNVVHALAALAIDPAVGEVELVRRLDDVWRTLDLGPPWHARAQREVAVGELRKFLRWHSDNLRALVAVEEDFVATIGRADLRGRVDRIERDAKGRGVVVDLKTGSSKPAEGELPRQPQLGVYQLAVALGAFRSHQLAEPGGAELLQLGTCAFKGGARVQEQPPLAEDDDPEWAAQLLLDVTEQMSGPRFRVTVNDHCRTCAARASCPLQPEGARVTP